MKMGIYTNIDSCLRLPCAVTQGGNDEWKNLSMFLDAIQILAAFVIVLLTIVLFIIGIQVFNILKELKITFKKVNKILDDAGRITESIAEPIEEASDFVMGLKRGVEFFETISSFFKRRKKEKSQEDTKNSSQTEQALEKEPIQETEIITSKKSGKSNKRRFFTRKGKSLGK